MTIEMAADMVIAMREQQKIRNEGVKIGSPEYSTMAEELFSHFYDYFGVGYGQGAKFAELCGYGIASDAEIG